ncbi:hypothetical protein [Bradyrhizobium sp. 174]|uniref:hypothetical protein n=1 Tax=Bradyrhizobium sp. 174 TaxID=2782645 RepID=UPI001FF8FA1F|nr:hypothetical protein [Bradyrhizobium sp. 174]MCK1577856.1 hypothetical protein [Bradyrhizobium sp. 174]
MDRTFVQSVLHDRSVLLFALIAMLSDAPPMANTSYALKELECAPATPVAMKHDDWARAALAGTRMLIAEESFDAILQMLIDAGLVPRGCAAVMLDRLSEKLLMHASGRTDTHWAIRAPELLDQAGRLAAKASAMRATVRLHT